MCRTLAAAFLLFLGAFSIYLCAAIRAWPSGFGFLLIIFFTGMGLHGLNAGWNEFVSAREVVKKLNREQAKQEQAQREQAQREQAQREQAQREQAQREQAQREQAQRGRDGRAQRTSGRVSIFEDHRLVLELSEVFTLEDVRRQYKDLISIYHPDKVSNLGAKIIEVAEEHTKKLNAAYDYFREYFKCN